MHCVDLGESFPTHIFLQNFALIQPRTNPLTFARSPNECSTTGEPGGGTGRRRAPRGARRRRGRTACRAAAARCSPCPPRPVRRYYGKQVCATKRFRIPSIVCQHLSLRNRIFFCSYRYLCIANRFAIRLPISINFTKSQWKPSGLSTNVDVP